MVVVTALGEGLRREGVLLALLDLFAGANGAGLDGATLGILVTENVRILVRSSCDLAHERLLSKVVVTLVRKALRLLMVWLVVEGVTLRSVIVARAAVVVHDVLVGVAEHVRAVLALLQFSSFCHGG